MSEGNRRKRCSRPKTQYSICHPPPKNGAKSKISIRPRSLLQLHQLVTEGRPKPAFELLPSATFSPKLTRAIARVFGARHSISTTDLALVRAEEYHRHEESIADEDESRDVLALICGAGKKENGGQAKMRILFADGSDWDAYQMSNGSYECSKTDVHGLKTTVRWVQKKSGMRTPDATTETDMSTIPEKKFNFSTIAANTRRHPIIAHLTNTGLDISDIYSMPSPSTPALTPDAEDPTTPGGEQIYTTDELRNVITATAAFVAVREGWCPTYRSEDSLQRSPSTKSVHSSYATPPSSPRKGEADFNRRSSSFRRAMRAPSLLRRTERPSSPTMEASTLAGETAVNSPFLDATPARRRARADTTSTVIVNSNATQWRPDFAAPEEDDDEEEEDDDEEDDKETVNGDDVRNPQLDGASEVKPRGSRGSDRKVSDTSSSGGDSQYWNGNTEKAAPRSGTVKEKKKSSKFLRILACGMI